MRVASNAGQRSYAAFQTLKFRVGVLGCLMSRDQPVATQAVFALRV